MNSEPSKQPPSIPVPSNAASGAQGGGPGGGTSGGQGDTPSKVACWKSGGGYTAARLLFAASAAILSASTTGIALNLLAGRGGLGGMTICGLLAGGVAALLAGVACCRAFREELSRLHGLEQAMRLKSDDLQRTEASFTTMFRSNPLPALIADLDGHIKDANDAWLDTFGYRLEQVRGHTTAELRFYVDPQERREAFAMVGPGRDLLAKPVHLWLPDGSTRTYLLSMATFELAEGWRYVSLLLDQTDRLAAAEAQRALNVDLEQRVAARTSELSAALDELRHTQDELVQSEKLAALGAMVAGVAHEINTPLGNAIMMASSLADHQSRFELGMEAGVKRSTLNGFLKSVRDVTDLVDRNLRRIENLVANFKQVAVNQASEQRHRFDLALVVDDMTATLRPGLNSDAYTLHNEVAPGTMLDSYPGPLGQVLMNLAHNALRHAFDGRERGQIRVRAEPRSQGWIRIVFSDDGNGIAAHNQPHVFDPFFTSKLGQGGSGLGLAIAHNIVSGMLGGRIELASAAGQGTEFRIDLPLSAPGAAVALVRDQS